jgi:hypothetical protein
MIPEEALAYCLTEIEAGRKTAAECAALFPDVPDLEAQLRAAQTLRVWQAPTIRSEISRRFEARVRQRARARRPRNSGVLALPLRWAIALALLAFLFLSAGTVAASTNSLPGETLYPVKRASESAQLFLASPADRAALHATFAGRRLNEIAALVERGAINPETLTALTTEVAAETEAALADVKNAPAANQTELLNTIILETERQQTVLQQIKETATPQLQAQLDQALQAAIQNNAAAQHNRGGSTGETASPTSTSSPTFAPAETLADVTSTATSTEATQTSFGPIFTTAPATQAATHTPASQAAQLTLTQTHIPPGQAKKTETAVGLPAGTPAPGNPQPGGTPSDPNCNANNPNSPNYCTPTSDSASNNPPPENGPTATACPTNASGKPKCK